MACTSVDTVEAGCTIVTDDRRQTTLQING